MGINERGEGRPSERSQVLAQQLTDRFLAQMENIEGVGPPEYAQEDLGIYRGDIELAVDRFGLQLALCREFHLPFACLSEREKSYEPIPIDLIDFYGPGPLPNAKDIRRRRLRPMWPSLFWPDDVIHSLNSIKNNLKGLFPENLFEIKEYPAEVARGFFSNKLRDFLASRFDAQNLSSSGSPGLQFKVVTKTKGLRVHYSPAYFFNPWTIFGSPTSPVYGWIHPGRYLFGVMGSQLPLQFDQALFDIPPCTEARLTI